MAIELDKVSEGDDILVMFDDKEYEGEVKDFKPHTNNNKISNLYVDIEEGMINLKLFMSNEDGQAEAELYTEDGEGNNTLEEGGISASFELDY